MDGLKKAMEYLVDLAAPHTLDMITESGEIVKFVDKNMRQIVPKANIPMATDAINMSTLTSLVDYIKNGIDIMKGRMILHVVSPAEVQMYSALNENREREKLVTVNANIPKFSFDRFMDKEQFLIALQSKFIPGTDRDLLLKFAGTVEDGTVQTYGDDGVTQKATIKTGLASKSDAVVPNPVCLRPYRTFIEVSQPESQFIFRMKQDKYDGVSCAIFEADGGAWINEAMENIKEYLQFELEGFENFTVIA